MCTAITYNKGDFYFGRTLDYEFSYGDKITVTPRNYRFDFGKAGICGSHYAMIGMAHIADNYPLYYEAVNEKGLGMAGLNFVDNAVYGTKSSGEYPIAPHEFIPFMLSRCENLSQARKLLDEICLVDRGFSEKLPVSQLHWIIADKSGAITVESTKNGMFVYDNQAGVLTNNPEFPAQILHLSNYMGLSAKPPENNLCSSIELPRYSRGMGAIGLPGDWSSESRFVRAVFVKLNSVCGDTEIDAVSQFFHMIGAVDIPRGCCDLGDNKYHITRYTCCTDCSKGIYYYTTYESRRISAVNMHHENLNGCRLACYDPVSVEQIVFQN